MDELVVTCSCGKSFTVRRGSTGQAVECTKCGKLVRVTEANSREMTQAERDVRLFFDEEEKPSSPASRPQPLATVATRGDAVGPPRDACSVSVAPSQGSDPRSPRQTPLGAAAAEASRFLQEGGPGGAKVPRCARCNRPFRGPWDQVDTDEGTLCHICANKIDNFVRGAAPSRPQTGEQSEIMREIARQQSWSLPGMEPPPEAVADDAGRRRRQVAILGAVAVLTITVALLLPEGALFPAGGGEAPRELPQSFAYLIVAMNALLHVATYAIAIYYTLVVTQRLPNETLLANVLAVSIVAVLVYVVNFIPFCGYILGIIVIYRFYDLSLFHLIVLGVFGYLAEMCTTALGQLIFGIMGTFVR